VLFTTKTEPNFGQFFYSNPAHENPTEIQSFQIQIPKKDSRFAPAGRTMQVMEREERVTHRVTSGGVPHAFRQLRQTGVSVRRLGGC
jgi:hypothetical protein